MKEYHHYFASNARQQLPACIVVKKLAYNFLKWLALVKGTYGYIFVKSSLHPAKENICGSPAPSNALNCLLALLLPPAPSIVSSELKIPDFCEDCDQRGVCHLFYCILPLQKTFF